jgi:predicted DNA-binding transcriptional regulator AlpA
MNTDHLWSADEVLLPASTVAGILGVSTDTLTRMAARGEGPPRIRVSRQWRYPLCGIREWKAVRANAQRLNAAAPRPDRPWIAMLTHSART